MWFEYGFSTIHYEYGFIVKLLHVYPVRDIQSIVLKTLVSHFFEQNRRISNNLHSDVHITNNAVQKTAPNYDPEKGTNFFRKYSSHRIIQVQNGR